MRMQLQKEESGYKFYIGVDGNNGKTVYNIVPSHSSIKLTSGYYNREYIEKIKGVKFN